MRLLSLADTDCTTTNRLRLSLNFLILAKLSHATVGQAFYFFFVVYVLAYLKATKPPLFGFSLLGILMSFNGVYNG